MKFNKIHGLILSGLCLPTLAGAATLNLSVGWNLLGNSDAASIDVASRFGDKTKITTVWKWNKTSGTWAFYAPSMLPADLSTYANRMGYDVLSSITPKEGYWVNAAIATVVSDPSATPVAAAAPLQEADLAQGWNLAATASNQNPSQINTGLKTSLAATDKAISTMWAWDAPSSRWRFYSPGLEALSATALPDYLAKKSYLPFATAPSPTEGFWVNIVLTKPNPDPVVLTPLALAKTFVTALNSNATALSAKDLSLQTDLQAVADDMKNRTAPLANSGINALKFAMRAEQFWRDVIKTPAAPFVQQRTFNDFGGYYGNNPVTNGACGFYSDTNYQVAATSKADAKYVACGSAVQYSDVIQPTDDNGVSKQCTTVGELCGTRWSYRVRLNPDPVVADQFTVYTMTREAKLTVNTMGYSYWDSITNQYVNTAATCPANVSYCQTVPTSYNEIRTDYGAAFPGNAATLVTQRDTSGKLATVKLVGELSPDFSITSNPSSYYDASLQYWVYKPNQVATLLGDKHHVALSGVLTQNGDIDKLALSGSIELIKSGVLETRLALGDGSYVLGKPDGTGGYQAHDGSQEMLLKLSGGTAASTIKGDLKTGAFQLDASGTDYTPTLVSFTGSVQRNGVGFFDGSITAEQLNRATYNANTPISSTNVLQMRGSLSGTITISNRPTLYVTLMGNNSDAGSSSSSVSGQYVQGNLTINLSGSKSGSSNVLTLESTEGIRLIVDKAQTIYPLTKGGVLLGEFSTLTHVLTYVDGSYEQF